MRDFSDSLCDIETMLGPFRDDKWIFEPKDTLSINNHVRNTRILEIIKQDVSKEEKRIQLYNYILELLLDYKEKIRNMKFICRDDGPYVFGLINVLSARKNEETYEATEKILNAIRTLYE